ncbi:hypothetical protein DENSPDRAFT_788006 [Dentipellis sp. KUC8613]|nr:hypothetical protein DENSPDRAFT_788006 [Dentipellis sp. KUC8613]
MSSSTAHASLRLLRAVVLQQARSTVRPPRSHLRRTLDAAPRRTFATTRPRSAAPAPRPPSHPSVLLAHPTEEDFDKHDLRGEPVPEAEARIDITDRAAERLRAVAEKQGNPDAALRISVESGGCHGYQYKIELTQKERWPDDYHFTHPTIKPSNIYVDAISLGLMKGSTVDFATELIGSSFRVTDNPLAKDAGCGCGVSWEPKFE